LVKGKCVAVLAVSTAYSAAALSKGFEVVEGKVPRLGLSESALRPPYSILVLSMHHIDLIKRLISKKSITTESIIKTIGIGNAQIPL
jgi:hypothetical protein